MELLKLYSEKRWFDLPSLPWSEELQHTNDHKVQTADFHVTWQLDQKLWFLKYNFLEIFDIFIRLAYDFVALIRANKRTGTHVYLY